MRAFRILAALPLLVAACLEIGPAGAQEAGTETVADPKAPEEAKGAAADGKEAAPAVKDRAPAKEKGKEKKPREKKPKAKK